MRGLSMHTVRVASPNHTILKKRALNGWSLWALVAVPMSFAVMAMMTAKDLSQPADLSSRIQFSVRCSVPSLYLAFSHDIDNLDIRRRQRGWVSRWIPTSWVASSEERRC